MHNSDWSSDVCSSDLLTLLDVLDRRLERVLDTADCAARDLQALPGQLLHQHREAHARRAENVGLGHTPILEEQLAGVLSLPAHLLQRLAFRKAGAIRFADPTADALGSAVPTAGLSDH